MGSICSTQITEIEAVPKETLMPEYTRAKNINKIEAEFAKLIRSIIINDNNVKVLFIGY